MISLDTNLLAYAYAPDAPNHAAALDFINSLGERNDVAVSEFVLVEFYRLLRNPTVVAKPLKEAEAASVIASYRQHPRWRTVGFPEGGSMKVHQALWRTAATAPFAYRRIYDARLALTLLEFGVDEFATSNVKDFQGFGFKRVWNPCMKES